MSGGVVPVVLSDMLQMKTKSAAIPSDTNLNPDPAF
jgi:hypothetical protein